MRQATISGLLVVAAAWISGCGGSGAPSTKQCKDTWQLAPSGEKVLECTFKGGERLTNQLGGQSYLNPVGSCWDYDVVVAQRCGCRRFVKSSICCRKGSTGGCEWRIGDSAMVDCSQYGQPKFGLSGGQEPSDCKQKRAQSECFARKDLLFQGAVLGPCLDGGTLFTCPNGQATESDFLNGRCGPTPEDCGCKLVEECSTAEGLACYRKWSGDKEAVACFASKPGSYEARDCYARLIQSRGGQ